MESAGGVRGWSSDSLGHHSGIATVMQPTFHASARPQRMLLLIKTIPMDTLIVFYERRASVSSVPAWFLQRA